MSEEKKAREMARMDTTGNAADSRTAKTDVADSDAAALPQSTDLRGIDAQIAALQQKRREVLEQLAAPTFDSWARLPWTHRGGMCISATDHCVLIVTTPDGPSGDPAIYRVQREVTEFVHRACNAHGELVAALKGLLPIAERMQATCEDGETKCYDNEFDARDAVEYAQMIGVAKAVLANAGR